MIRRGAVTADGKGEAVLVLGFMLMAENSHDVTTRLKARLEVVKKTLPKGVQIATAYDRTSLVDQVLHTVEKNLLEGALLVVAVIFVFLVNLRAGLIVALAIPLPGSAGFWMGWIVLQPQKKTTANNVACKMALSAASRQGHNYNKLKLSPYGKTS